MCISTQQWRWFQRQWLPLVVLCGFWVVFCSPLLSGKSVAIYRDSAHLYWPLYHWIEEETAAHGLPLWNPLDDFGYSVLEDATSALLYPGKLIFKIPGVSYTYRFGLYQALHILLAALGGYWCARWMGVRPRWALLSGVSYGFSGPVIFQATNVIYLVSAAWLPWAIGAVWVALAKGRIDWGIAAGCFVAMMVLGGDLQLAVMVLLLVAGTTAIWTIRDGFRARRLDKLSIKVALVAIAIAGVGAGLSAVQWVSTLRMVRESERLAGDTVPTLWRGGIGGAHSTENLHGTIWSPPEEGTHHDAIYQFSQPPWTLAELIWPNISGRLYPQHSRWIDGLPGAERMWHASLYQGVLIVFVAAVGVFRKARGRERWILVWGSLACVGSFGWYGAVWLLRECGLLEDESLGSQIGGLYWFLIVSLPGFEAFRYPAKLFPIVSLAIALLAAHQFPNLLRRPSRHLIPVVIAIVLASIAAERLFTRQVIEAGNFFVTADGMFGPFSPAISQQFVIWGTATTAIIFLILMRLMFGSWGGKINRHAGFFVSLLVLSDLWLANSDLLPFVAQSRMENVLRRQMEKKEDIAVDILDDSAAHSGTISGTWRHSEADERLAEIVEWQANSDMPKFHLLSRTHRWNSFLPVSRSGVWDAKGGPIDAMEIIDADISQRLKFEGWPQRWFDESKCLVLVKMSHLYEADSQIPIQQSNSDLHDHSREIERPFEFWTNDAEFKIKTLPYQHLPNGFAVDLVEDESGILIFPVKYNLFWEVTLEKDQSIEALECMSLLGNLLGVELKKGGGKLEIKQFPLMFRREYWVSGISVFFLTLIAIGKYLLKIRSNLKRH